MIESAIYFGMSRKEFMSLRLSEAVEYIEICKKRKEEESNNQMIFVGTICATIANFSMGKKNKKFKAKDFFKIKNQKPQIENVENQVFMLMTLTKQMGGDVNIGK